MKLADIADYVEESVKSDCVTLDDFVTTDSLLQNKAGRARASNLPPEPVSLTSFRKGDTLVANIRPYLRKIWLADRDGGCSQDVLVFRAKDQADSEYLYSLLLQESFFDYVMLAPKGSKMPRGDERHIMRFPIADLPKNQRRRIGRLLSSLDRRIALARRKIAALEKLAKEIYDYWFVQYDFPDADGRPYRSSGGRMVFSPELKRAIPEGWRVGKLGEIAEVVNGATPSTTVEKNYGGEIAWITPKDLSDQGAKFVFNGARNITQAGYDSCSTHLLPEGSVLMSSRAPIGLLSIAANQVCTNQGFKSFVPKFDGVGSFLFYYLKNHMPEIEALGSGTTFKEVSRESMLSFQVPLPEDMKFMSRWENSIDSTFKSQKNLQRSILTLTRLRDFLLPMLMNGQVEINE